MRANILQVVAFAAAGCAAAAGTTTTALPECTALSSTGSGAFFDLRPDIAHPPVKGKQHKTGITKDYHSRGHDYGKNFTLNICGPVVDPVEDVVGVSKGVWANVSAYYTYHGDVYSIGSESLDLKSRGRELVLQYTGGSPCGKKTSNKSSLYSSSKKYQRGTQAHKVEVLRDDDDNDDSGKKSERRKSAIISFACDRDPTTSQATVSFIGTDPDECAYFFKARSIHACAQAEPHRPGSVGPGSVFGIILVIAVLVYALGGVFYNRTVGHARGWRQLPNYSLWAGIWSFFSDMFVILFSSCARFLPGRRGYRHISSSPSGRNRNSEAENRLIDQLDEEWDE